MELLTVTEPSTEYVPSDPELLNPTVMLLSAVLPELKFPDTPAWAVTCSSPIRVVDSVEESCFTWHPTSGSAFVRDELRNRPRKERPSKRATDTAALDTAALDTAALPAGSSRTETNCGYPLVADRTIT